MKKVSKKTFSKLQLNKQTIANLDNNKGRRLVGGDQSCTSKDTCVPTADTCKTSGKPTCTQQR
jgi:hypothetical protein